MLTKLTLHDFRGFGDLVLEGFARANLIVGTNSVGKTSVMEGLYLLCEQHARPAVKEILDRRKYNGGEPNILLSLRSSGRDNQEVVITGSDGARTWASSLSDKSGRLMWASWSNDATGNLRMVTNGVNAWGNNEFDERPHAIWFDLAATSDLMVAKRLGKLRRRNRMGDILQWLQRVDPRVEDISQIEEEGAPHMEVFVKMQGLPEWIRLTQAGHGLRYAAALFTELDGAKDAIVLIDEIEVGLHHDVLDAVWKTIRAVAEANNLQIFATTHSYECIKAADAAFADAQDDLRLIRLQRVKGTVRAIDYPPDVRHGALEDGMEVR